MSISKISDAYNEDEHRAEIINNASSMTSGMSLQEGSKYLCRRGYYEEADALWEAYAFARGG